MSDARVSCVSLRWSETNPGYWTGVIAGRVWTLTQSEEQLWYTLHEEEKEEDRREEEGLSEPPVKKSRKQLHPETSRPTGTTGRSGGEQVRGVDGLDPSQILRDYFQLHVSLSALYQGWSYTDAHFRNVAVKFPGRKSQERWPVRDFDGLSINYKWQGGCMKAESTWRPPEVEQLLS